jgi:hypothetical protein
MRAHLASLANSDNDNIFSNEKSIDLAAQKSAVKHGEVKYVANEKLVELGDVNNSRRSHTNEVAGLKRSSTLRPAKEGPKLNIFQLIRHASIILALPLFCVLVANLYTRGILKTTKMPGSLLLHARTFAHTDWYFHCVIILLFLAAILLVSRGLTSALYVCSIVWACLFLRNL